MPEINDLLDAERNRRRSSAGRARIALIVAGAATVVAVGTGATLVAMGASSLVEYEAQNSAAADLVSSAREQAMSSAASGVSGGEGAAAEPAPSVPAPSVPTPGVPTPSEPTSVDPHDAAEAAQKEFGFPVYDASTDIATIPRPVDDYNPANTEVWLLQLSIIADCMREKGLEYRYTVYWQVPSVVARELGLAPFEPQSGTDEFEALHGVREFGPDDPEVAPEYRWEDAGCVGYAVHVTGMDDAH